MEMPPPPYQGRKHLKKLSEFVAELTPEAVQRLADARDRSSEHLPAIRQRLDALRDAIDDDWCAPRGIENQIGHLYRALSPHHLSRYLKDALAALNEAEADLAIWQQMTEAQRDERWDERKRDKIEAEERRAALRAIEDRKSRLYDIMPMGICPKKGTPVRLQPRKGTPLDILLTNITDPHFTGTT